MSGVNPQGCQVFSFKKPSDEEIDHTFLWRYMKALPERGRIGIFNRSYYEDVLVVRVTRRSWSAESCRCKRGKAFWQKRFNDINNFERHLTRNGTLVLKFFLNISKDQQLKRFMERLTNPENTGRCPMQTSTNASTGTTTRTRSRMHFVIRARSGRRGTSSPPITSGCHVHSWPGS
jgi:polyphosphate kinase 2 (PPK2 family)